MNKEDVLIFDIECFSSHDINTPEYVIDAKAKWFGCYSYNPKAGGKYFCIKVKGNKHLINSIIAEHKVVVGFNSIDFDGAILKNQVNNLWPETERRIIELDLQKILKEKRGNIMKLKAKNNSLQGWADAMKIPVHKGEIDFMLFKKDEWTPEEEEQIKKYLKADVEIARLMFEKLYNYWLPFTQFLSQRNIDNWTWLSCSEGSLAYKWYCNVMGISEEYADKGPKTDGGGRVIEPRVDEETDVVYIDFASLYPHMYVMFNLLAEVAAFTPGSWHGNDTFKVNGFYDISKQHKHCLEMMKMLVGRLELKKTDPDNPLTYTYKILLNSFYGANRSMVFKNLYTLNAGADCCYLGRQISEFTEREMIARGYKVLAGDTDSLFVKHSSGKVTYEKVKQDLKEIIALIKQKVPFPVDTFNIDIEAMINYIMFVKDKKDEDKTLKKNYMYIKHKVNASPQVVVMGLPIKKANATALGPLIFKKYIEPRILAENKGKFEKDWIVSLVKTELKENLELTAQEYNCNRFEMYTEAGKKSLPAQISKEYLNGRNGKIKLIKNTRIGKVGGNFFYCTIDEARKANLSIESLDLKKTYNELSPFCVEELDAKTINRPPSYFNKPSEGGSTIDITELAKPTNPEFFNKRIRGQFE